MTSKRKAPAGSHPDKGSSKHSQHVQDNSPDQKLLLLASRLTCRHERLLRRLVDGPLPRLEGDRVTGTTNSPEYIRQLRNDFQLQIETERVEVIDRDGFKARPGIYHLKPESLELALAILDASEARRAA